MNYNAAYFGNLFVEVAQRPSSRVSYHVDKDNPFLIKATGYGNIPYDTGRTQRSVFLSRVAPTSCTVRFNGETSPYVGRSDVPDSHRNCLQKVAKNEVVRELQRQFKEVRIQ